LEQATKLQKDSHSRLASALVKLGSSRMRTSPTFSRASTACRHQSFFFEIDPAVVKLIPYETAKRYQILPLSRVGASLTIAMVDPTNVFAMDDIKFMTGFNIEPVVLLKVPSSRESIRPTALPKRKSLSRLCSP